MLQRYEVQLKKTEGFNTIESCVKHSITTGEDKVGAVIRNGGKDLIQLHVTEAIATYVSLLPANKGVSTEAVITMGKYLTEHPDLKHLSLSELKTFFNMAFKQQRFGKLYGGFGYDTLLEWFNQFFDLRIQEVINIRENEHNRITAHEKDKRNRTDGDAFGGFNDLKTIYNGQGTTDETE